jgi:hypothetical protein
MGNLVGFHDHAIDGNLLGHLLNCLASIIVVINPMNLATIPNLKISLA